MGRPHATSSGVSPTITTSVPRNVRPVSALARAAATAGRSDRRDESEPYAPTRKRAGSSPADSSFSAAPTARFPVSGPTRARPAASGDLAVGAALKLESAGLDPARFRVGAYGSDSSRRSDLPAVAAARASALTGRTFRGTDVVIVGDTPDDVACGRPVGARSVAVATGSYDVAALNAAGATYVFETLVDTAAVLDAIFA